MTAQMFLLYNSGQQKFTFAKGMVLFLFIYLFNYFFNICDILKIS